MERQHPMGQVCGTALGAHLPQLVLESPCWDSPRTLSEARQGQASKAGQDAPLPQRWVVPVPGAEAGLPGPSNEELRVRSVRGAPGWIRTLDRARAWPQGSATDCAPLERAPVLPARETVGGTLLVAPSRRGRACALPTRVDTRVAQCGVSQHKPFGTRAAVRQAPHSVCRTADHSPLVP